MTQRNFRDFAGAIMGNDVPRAAEVLSILLGLDPEAAASAATLGECFGVSSDAMPVAIATLRKIYPRPA